MIHKGDSLPGSTGSRSCNRFSRTPLSEAVAKHIDLSATRRETLSWLALLIMQHGTICLWRLAAFVASAAQTSRFSRAKCPCMTVWSHVAQTHPIYEPLSEGRGQPVGPMLATSSDGGGIAANSDSCANRAGHLCPRPVVLPVPSGLLPLGHVPKVRPYLVTSWRKST